MAFLTAVSLVTNVKAAEATMPSPSDQGRFAEYHSVTSQYLPEPVSPLRVTIWLPPGYDHTTDRYPVVYMHDGQNLFDPARSNFNKVWAADKSALRLIQAKKIRPFIIVGIDHPGLNRARTYMPASVYNRLPTPDQQSLFVSHMDDILSDAYLLFLTKELKPQIDRSFRTRTEPYNTVIVGSSMGGLISLYALAKYPNVFGRAGCLSTHWPLGDPTKLTSSSNESIIQAWQRFIADELKTPNHRRLWLDHGTETLDAYYDPYQREIDAALVKQDWRQDVDFSSKVYNHAAHEENAWAARLDEVFLFLMQ